MQPLARAAVFAGLAAGLLAGCSGGEAANPAGPDANSGKSYTKAEADKIQPKRHGDDSGK